MFLYVCVCMWRADRVKFCRTSLWWFSLYIYSHIYITSIFAPTKSCIQMVRVDLTYSVRAVVRINGTGYGLLMLYIARDIRACELLMLFHSVQVNHNDVYNNVFASS